DQAEAVFEGEGAGDGEGGVLAQAEAGGSAEADIVLTEAAGGQQAAPAGDRGGEDGGLADVGAVEVGVGALEAEVAEGGREPRRGVRTGEKLVCRGEDGGGFGRAIAPGPRHADELGALTGAEDDDGISHEEMLGGEGVAGRGPAAIPRSFRDRHLFARPAARPRFRNERWIAPQPVDAL